MNAARAPACAAQCVKACSRGVEKRSAAQGEVGVGRAFPAVRAAEHAGGSAVERVNGFAGSAQAGAGLYLFNRESKTFLRADNPAGLPACEAPDAHRFGGVAWYGCLACACCGSCCVRSWGSSDCGSTMVSKLPIIRADGVWAFLEGIV